MRKTVLMLLLIPGLLVGLTSNTNAQNFEGIATYQSSMDLGSIDVAGGGNMTPDMQESIRKQLAQSAQRTYILTFNVQEATWKEEAELDPVSNSGGNSGMQVRFSAGGGLSYLNPSKNEFLEETEIFGKKFLVTDELPEFRWKITGETKKIGDYTVTKAEHMDISERTVFALSDTETTTETRTDTTMVTAWFTQQIPVSQGPANSWGLPGLILEFKTGNLSYLCTKVELNPKTPITIEKPSKGKRVTRAEADQINDEKMQEMMKKYDTGDGGETRIIRIGG